MNFLFCLYFFTYTNANASNQKCSEIKTRVENTIPECAELAIYFSSFFYLSKRQFIYGNFKQSELQAILSKRFPFFGNLKEIQKQPPIISRLFLKELSFFLFSFLNQARGK